jgi:hypothetical protein
MFVDTLWTHAAGLIKIRRLVLGNFGFTGEWKKVHRFVPMRESAIKVMAY